MLCAVLVNFQADLKKVRNRFICHSTPG